MQRAANVGFDGVEVVVVDEVPPVVGFVVGFVVEPAPVPALADAAALLARVSVSFRIAITCSSSLNCASCETNCVLSVGLSGS